MKCFNLKTLQSKIIIFKIGVHALGKNLKLFHEVLRELKVRKMRISVQCARKGIFYHLAHCTHIRQYIFLNSLLCNEAVIIKGAI